MKIELELDDRYYQALRELLGEDLDLAVALSEMLKVLIISFGSDPEAFIRAHASDSTSEDKRAFEDRFKEVAKVIVRKAQKPDG